MTTNTLKEKARLWVQNQRIEKPSERISSVILLIVLLCLVWFARLFPATHVPRYVPLSIAGQEHFLEYARAKHQQKQGMKKRPGLWHRGGTVFDLGENRPITVTMDEINFSLTVFTLTEYLEILEVVQLQPKDKHVFGKSCRYMVQIPRRNDLVPGTMLEHFNPKASMDLDIVTIGSREVF